MAERSLGWITPGVNPDPVTANQSDPTAKVMAHKFRVWHSLSNTGSCYIGDSTLEPSTGEGLYGILYPLGIVNGPQTLVYESQVVEGTKNPIDLATVYISADNAVDQFLVSYIEA